MTATHGALGSACAIEWHLWLPCARIAAIAITACCIAVLALASCRSSICHSFHPVRMAAAQHACACMCADIVQHMTGSAADLSSWQVIGTTNGHVTPFPGFHGGAMGRRRAQSHIAVSAVQLSQNQQRDTRLTSPATLIQTRTTALFTRSGAGPPTSSTAARRWPLQA